MTSKEAKEKLETMKDSLHAMVYVITEIRKDIESLEEALDATEDDLK